MNRVARALAAAGLLLCIVVTPPVLAHAANSDTDGGANLTVTVTDGSTPSATPRPSASAPAAAPTGGAGGPGDAGATSPGGGEVSSGGAGGGSSSGGGTPPGGEGVAGIVYLSGVNSSVGLSPDPGSGEVTLWLSVRNASRSVIDLTADFWMESVLFAVPLDDARGVPVTGVQPGETRLLSMRLHGAGQWGLVNTHVRITPPPVVDGTSLTPVTREAMVVVFPWFAALVAALVVIGILVWRAVALAMAAKPAAEAAA